MHATGPRGLRIEPIVLDGRPVLRVTMRNILIGRGFYATIPDVLDVLRRYGVDPDDLVFDYSDPADPAADDPACE